MITPNSLVLGDALHTLGQIEDGSIDLIYIDPPFNTGKVRKLDSILLNEGDSERKGFGGQTYMYKVKSSMSFDDTAPRVEYLDFMESCLLEARRVLKDEHGSIYVHVGWHVVHELKLLLDHVFGQQALINEIIWAYDYGGRYRNRWPAKHDYILWYAKTPGHWIFNVDEIDRLAYMAPGLVGPEKAARGKLPTDVWWMTIVPTNSKERVGYPTQKPIKLLKRIVQASSLPGHVVLDFFSGTGTTGVVSEKLGRKWILIDNNPEAITLSRQRLVEAGAEDIITIS